MAARFSNLLWRFDLFLGGSIWIALLALAYSAGPIEEAVFWASLIAALPRRGTLHAALTSPRTRGKPFDTQRLVARMGPGYSPLRCEHQIRASQFQRDIL
jgi:hypothetical protein